MTNYERIKNMSKRRLAIQLSDFVDCDTCERMSEERKELNMEDDIIRCPYCNSARIFGLRIDGDWGSGIGSYYPENDESEYTQDDLKLDSYDRPDIDLYHCLGCGRMFEEECL